MHPNDHYAVSDTTIVIGFQKSFWVFRFKMFNIRFKFKKLKNDVRFCDFFTKLSHY